MRFEGTLQDWNYERGFGAIAPAQGGQALFVHVSAFPADGVAPALGEALSFEMTVDAKGQKKAVHVLRSKGKQLPPTHTLLVPAPKRGRGRAGRRRWKSYLLLALVLLVAVLSLQAWFSSIRPRDHGQNVAGAPVPQQAPKPGKTHQVQGVPGR
ncbi:cold shock CspA family protein [Paucibacter oligotrophus]|uniref:Cold shock CspA family protein n=1 Tax=Roseateles oligotrophus TaxID=1769250 RepID=A0A840LES6_9BURK|nr:cold shock domain-containing protein [Roseateles oligotrophus]MBB4844698.1 cold shock CspA family protein [Roseateles oligotrophus]